MYNMDGVFGALVFVGALFGLGIAAVVAIANYLFWPNSVDPAKVECEQNLPRHIECVWAVPEGFE